MNTIRARLFCLGAALSLFVPVAGRATPTPAPRGSQAAREAAFLRTVKPRDTAEVMTGDLAHFAGTHVAYDCDVDSVIVPGVILGQCGYEPEPVDLFVRLPTAHLRTGDRVRVLGIMQRPASWTDLMGHTVYYAFVQAVYVHRLPEHAK